MEMQLQPDSSSCMVTALAMCVDEPVANVITRMGHNGRTVLYPRQEGARKYRGFHVQELVWYCLTYTDVVPTYIELVPSFIDVDGEVVLDLIMSDSFVKKMMEHRCVLMGAIEEKQHAVAWCPEEEKCFDPEGLKYPVEDFEVWYILRCPNNNEIAKTPLKNS